VITQLPWLDKVCSGEQRTEDNTNTTNNNVRNTQEGVFAAHNCPCGYEHLLSSAVESDVKF
jgi:hypothetical protein